MVSTLPLAAGPQFLICFLSPPEFDHEDFFVVLVYGILYVVYSCFHSNDGYIYICVYQVYKPIGSSGFCRAEPGSFVKWNSMYFHKMLKAV